jgi:ribosomal protein L11 methyltransferase
VPSSYIEVRVLCPVGWHEVVADVLAIGPCTSVVLGRPNLGVDAAPDGFDWVRTFFPSDEDTPALREGITGGLLGVAESTGVDELAGLAATFHELPAEDWATSWKKSWKPFRVGRLTVVTHDWDRTPKPNDLRLVLEPGGAFGTGRHATTRTILALLQERDVSGARVLDAGTGTGILCVAAARLGAAHCLGFDIDTRSAIEGGDLATTNGVPERCTFRVGDFSVLDERDTGFDVVLANIYSDVVQAFAADLAARLGPAGWFAFSGCPDRHRGPTLAAIEAAGLHVEEVRQRGRWLTFVGQHAR